MKETTEEKVRRRNLWEKLKYLMNNHFVHKPSKEEVLKKVGCKGSPPRF